MAEINNSIAAGVNTAGPDLGKTLGVVSQFNAANAMAGLKDIQALQQQRQYNALQAAAAAYQSGKDPLPSYLGAGGDPSGASTLQNVFAGQRAMAITPGGLLPNAYHELTGAQQNLATTNKTNIEAGKAKTEALSAGTDFAGKLAQGVIADPSNDSIWTNAVNQHYQTVGGPSLERQQLLAVKDSATRMQIAKAYAAQGVPAGTFGAPHNVNPTDRIVTPAQSYQTAPLPPSQQGGMIGAPGERIIGGSVVQDNSGVVPNQRVSGGFGAMAPTMTPQIAAESKGYGEQLAKILPDLSAKADNSRQANFTLDQMRRESETWDMGKGGTALMTAQQYLKPIANMLGSNALDKPVADFEGFQKNTGTLVRQAVKEVSSRAAVQEFNLIQNQLPSANMSRQGFNQIANQFQSVNDFNIAKQQAAQTWRDRNGTMDRFESDWNKNVTPAAFLVARLPPEQLGALRANLERTAGGRSTLASIKKQLEWAHTNGLDQVAQ